MQKALSSDSNVIDIHHAGTAMRFLTAYFAMQERREVTLTGSSRMKERPIKILVDALNTLGADISYVEKEGFPPLKIKGKKLNRNKVAIQANTSSQYITALLLIGSTFEKGLELNLKGEITSVPYIKMTLALLDEIGFETTFQENKITVKPINNNQKSATLIVESDWSSASYFYSMIALSKEGTEIKLSSYKEKSLQGDSILAEIYKSFGVQTIFENNSMTLKKKPVNSSDYSINLVNAPDIAQTIAITAFGLGLKCDLYGLHTLKIKETDRLLALKTEIEKLGGEVDVTNDSLHLEAFSGDFNEASIDTYNDHRMAMAFAPLALKTNLKINDAEVVSKSYPDFWNDLKSIGFQISQ